MKTKKSNITEPKKPKTDVIKKVAKTSTQVTATRVERMTDVIATWNEIGIELNAKAYSEYEANNIYIILQDALKKIGLADK